MNKSRKKKQKQKNAPAEQTQVPKKQPNWWQLRALKRKKQSEAD